MIRRKIVLHFPPRLVDQPVIYHLVKDYDLVFNILQARITPSQEGLLIMEIAGRKKDYDRGLEYLIQTGVKVQPLSQDVTWNEEICTHCGACLAVCPTQALVMDKETMRIVFDNRKCIACEACVPACPPRAMEVEF